MSLFSTAPYSSAAEHSRELLVDYLTMLHNALSWRADSLRSMAASIDGVREDLEAGLGGVAAQLACWVAENQPEEGHELRADDDGKSS